MLRPGDRIVAAVSGGPDSLALLAALTALRGAYRLTLRAAYVDHGLRLRSAQKEAALVRQIGRLWKIPVDVLRRKVSKKAGESLEASARRIRYEALAALARRTRSRVLALGHTQDDQAETVLLWLLRGTGTTGLAGIPPVRQMRPASRGSIRIIRPLLDCSRKQVEAYLQELGIRPRFDRSNRSFRFLRNRIRHQLIPLLEREYNPQARRHLASLAQILREDREWMDAELEGKLRQVAQVRPGRVRLDRIRLLRFPPAVQKGLLRLSVRKMQGNLSGFRQSHWAALGAFLNGQNKAADLPHGFRVEVSGRWLWIGRRPLQYRTPPGNLVH